MPVTEITSSKDWSLALMAAKKPVVLDIYAPWCQPCRMLAPFIEELSQKHDGKVLFYKLNVEALPEFASSFKVTSLPTVHVYGGDMKLKRIVVGFNQRELKSSIEDVLSP